MQEVEPLQAFGIEDVVRHALHEDHAWADATTLAVVPDGASASGKIVAKQAGVMSGKAYAVAAFALCCPEGQFEWHAEDGDAVDVGQAVLTCSGAARGLLAAERTALNFLQQLSGVATMTAEAVAGAGSIKVLDTRKTIPGLRDGQKAAVVAGGGVNHRRDLEDQILLKENHFALSGRPYAATVALAVKQGAGKVVGAEAQNLSEAMEALGAGANYVMLDNFPKQSLPDSIEKIRSRYPEAEIELSGGLMPEVLSQLASLGVNRVSLGAITHSAPALDFSFLFDAPLS